MMRSLGTMANHISRRRTGLYADKWFGPPTHRPTRRAISQVYVGASSAAGFHGTAGHSLREITSFYSLCKLAVGFVRGATP